MQFDLTIQPVRTWQREGSAVFCRVREQWGECSNMHPDFGYEDQGLFWRSSEAQYQAGAFPHLPEHQERIRSAPNAMGAKGVAYERVNERMPGWLGETNLAMMAYVLTRKGDLKDFATILALTGEMPIVELSMRDDFWGAKPRGNVLVGRNMLGCLEMQLRAGARMDQLPEGVRFAAPAAAPAPRQSSLFGGAERRAGGFSRM
jgi:predicted NAD-dependent protein-ADP-ribosyltransferase YbiA (DUF1768 family)